MGSYKFNRFGVVATNEKAPCIRVGWVCTVGGHDLEVKDCTTNFYSVIKDVNAGVFKNVQGKIISSKIVILLEEGKSN